MSSSIPNQMAVNHQPIVPVDQSAPRAQVMNTNHAKVAQEATVVSVLAESCLLLCCCRDKNCCQLRNREWTCCCSSNCCHDICEIFGKCIGACCICATVCR